MTISWKKAVLIPAGAAFVGALGGGLLGFAAGTFGPDVYHYAMTTPGFWSVGVPSFLGAVVGGAAGGALACLGLGIWAGARGMKRYVF